MANLFAEQGDEIAAVITEPVQGAGGVRPPVDGYLAGLRRLCDQHGAYLIMDEVICAFGRLGHMFASDFYGVRPDLITFAKGVTSGLRAPRRRARRRRRSAPRSRPTLASGSVTATPTRATPRPAPPAWRRWRSPCARTCVERSKHVGDRLADGLRSLARDGLVAEVRGDGAVWAVALHEGQDPVAVRDRMLGRGVITRAVGTDTLTFCPPLVITDGQLDRIVDAVATCVG